MKGILFDRIETANSIDDLKECEKELAHYSLSFNVNYILYHTHIAGKEESIEHYKNYLKHSYQYLNNKISNSKGYVSKNDDYENTKYNDNSIFQNALKDILNHLLPFEEDIKSIKNKERKYSFSRNGEAIVNKVKVDPNVVEEIKKNNNLTTEKLIKEFLSGPMPVPSTKSFSYEPVPSSSKIEDIAKTIKQMTPFTLEIANLKNIVEKIKFDRLNYPVILNKYPINPIDTAINNINKLYNDESEILQEAETVLNVAQPIAANKYDYGRQELLKICLKEIPEELEKIHSELISLIIKSDIAALKDSSKYVHDAVTSMQKDIDAAKNQPYSGDMEARKTQTAEKTNNITEKESKIMATAKDIAKMTKDDATDAAYRVAGKQMSNVMRQALCKILSSKGAKKTQVKAFSDFLQTDIGEAFIQAILGYGLTYAPMLKDNPKFQVMAKEFRISAMATGGNAAMEAIMGELMPAMMPLLNGLPEGKLRIADPQQLEVSEEILLAAETANTASKSKV